MEKTNKTKVEEFIRVDHAGERGAIKIYEGQLLALNTFVRDDDLKKTIQEMKTQEKIPNENGNWYIAEIIENQFVWFIICFSGPDAFENKGVPLISIPNIIELIKIVIK